MIVSVNYRSPATGQFRGRAYSYLCDIPDIKPGDIVIAPTSSGDNEAVIVETNIPMSRVDDRIIPLLKAITKRKDEQPHAE